MNRFNLTFSGEILPGFKPAQVKASFARLFSIDDPKRVDLFFSGKSVVLRRNLERKEAADYFRKLHDIGLRSELVKVDEDGQPPPPPPEPPAPPPEPTRATERGMDRDILQRKAGHVDQSWAVPSRASKPAPPAAKEEKAPRPADVKKTAREKTETEAKQKAEAARKKAEEEAARKKAEEEAARKKAEEAARKKAEAKRKAEEEAARKKAEEAARKKAEAEAEAEAKRKAEEEAARKKDEDEAKRKAEAEAARKKAEEEAKRKTEAEAARKKAEEESRKKAEEEAARRRAEEEARKKAEAEAKRKAEEEAARKKAEEAARKKAEAEAKRKAEEEEARKKAEEAARKKAEAKRKAEEEAARKEAARKKAEEEARKKAEAEAKRKAEEEAARKKSEEAARKKAEAEAKRKAEEEAARKKAEEAARKKAEAEAKRKAEAEAARKKAEEEARKKAEAEAKRKAEEEAARKKAEEEARKKAEAEAKRKAEEEAARKKAEEEARKKAEAEAKRKAEEEAARKKAEEAARKKAEAEAKRKAEEEAARKKAEEEARKKAEAEAKRKAKEEAARKKAEEAARKKAEEEARKKAEASARQAALKEAARRKAEAEEAERQALAEEARYLAAAEAARKRAEELHRKAEEAERMAAMQLAETPEIADPTARQSAPEPITKAAEPATPQPAAPQPVSPKQAADSRPRKPPAKPAGKVIRTRVDLPVKKQLTATKSVTAKSPVITKRQQPGAPNLFNLRAFRSTAEIKQRGQRSQRLALTGLWTAVGTSIVLIVLALRFSAQPPPVIVTGADAIASSPNGDLLLIAGDTPLLHDRSGSSSEKVSIAGLTARKSEGVLIFSSTDEVILTSSGVGESEQSNLLRCQFNEAGCSPALAGNPDEWVSAAALHERSGVLYITNTRDGLLRKYDADGALVAEASKEITPAPVLRLADGLLLMNSSMGPAISVFRPDDGSFGRQLDEILLMPPAAVEAQQSRVSDFVRLGNNWWVTLENPDNGQRGVYHYDSQWKYLDRLQLPQDFAPEQLISWGDKLLVRDHSRPDVLRFAANGAPEVAFESTGLLELIASQTASARLADGVSRLVLATLAAVVLCALIFAYLQRVRGLVYKTGSTRGAEPLEDYTEQLQWLEPEAGRRSRFVQLASLYLVGCIGALITAVGLAVNTLQLAAVILALAGPAISLLLLYRSPIGHIGTSGDLFALVDHNNLYQLGRESQVHYRSRYLIIDDVVVFTGASLMPSFNRAQVAALKPLAEAGIKVERKAVWIKLLQARHPLAVGALITGSCWLLSAILVLV